jgi:DNA-directed RNA polymerase subunit beta'
LIPAGTGLAYHEQRRKRAAVDAHAGSESATQVVETLDVEEALKQALNVE